MIKRFRLYVIAGLLAVCQLSTGQEIAVQANINLLPPYTLSLHDYTQPESNKLMVTVLLKDLNIVTHQVRLRLTIEGSGFTLVTKNSYMPPPITLQGGIPEIIGSADLEPYFQPENMDFNGLNKNDYLRTKKLPEGFYRFYVEVLDYNRGSLVSNKAMAIAFIVLNEPPLINLPLNNTKLPANDPQSIMFNWAPRHLGSPNSAFTTLYEFRLYEIQPKGRNPYEAVRTTRPIYEAIPALTATSFNYNISMPALIPGNEYAFSIRAVDREGRDLFKNDGYSEVFKFTWGDECKFPEGIVADTLPGGIELKWKSAPAHTGYNISYKPAGGESWLTQNSFIDNASIYDLPGNTQIEYKIQSVCGGYFSDYSKVATIKTKEDEKRNFSCGSGNGLPAITNTTPKKTLNVGDKFTAGGYTAKVTKASGQDGTFTGECNVMIPFFSLAKVPHKFENIKINELNQMYEGKLVSIYNPNSKFLVRVKGGGGTPTETVKDSTATASTKTDSTKAKNTVEIAGSTNATVDSLKTATTGVMKVHTNSAGQIVVVNAAGDSTVLTRKEVEPDNQTVAETNNQSDSTTKADNSSDSTFLADNFPKEVSDTTATADEQVVENTDTPASINNSPVATSGGSESTNTPSGGNVLFKVQQDILQIGYKQIKPVVFSVFHNLKDVSDAKVEFIVDNPEQKQVYDLASLEDKNLDGTPSNTSPEKFYHSTWVPGLQPESFPQPGKHTLTFNLLKDDKQITKQILEIEVLPKYALTGLTATDAKYPKRIAKAGETLYLIKPNLLKVNYKAVNYKVTNEGGENGFWEGDIKWELKTDDNSISKFDSHKSTLNIQHKNFPNLVWNKNKNTVSVSAFNDQSKSVNIELLHQNLVKKEYTSLADLALLPAKLKFYSILESKLKGVIDPKFAFDISLKKATQTQNVEDIDSRFYILRKTDAYALKLSFNDILKNDRSDVTGNFSDTGKGGKKKSNEKVFFIPGLSYDLYFIKVGAYIKPILGLTLTYNQDFEMYNYEKDFKFIKDYFKAQLSGGVEFGLSVKTGEAIQGQLFVEVKAYGTATITGEYATNPRSIKVYLDPLIAGFSAKVELVSIGWEVVNFKAERQILDRQTLLDKKLDQ